MYSLIIKEKFDAAHYLPDYDGDCARLHGHSWKIDAEVQFDKIQPDGMGIDFKELKDIIKPSLPDHEDLNKYFDFVPTAENIAKFLYIEIAFRLSVYYTLINEKISLVSVTVWESDTTGAKYYE